MILIPWFQTLSSSNYKVVSGEVLWEFISPIAEVCESDRLREQWGRMLSWAVKTGGFRQSEAAYGWFPDHPIRESVLPSAS